MSRDLTAAERFRDHLDLLTRDLDRLGLFWRGDLAQFYDVGGNLRHECGALILLEEGERRLDLMARAAATHLLGCELRMAQRPVRPAGPGSNPDRHQGPETSDGQRTSPHS